MAEKLVDLVEEYQIHPIVGHVYEWEDAREAVQAAMEQYSIGKIVIKVESTLY
jgi:NADPH:quinone reductase-like Zn-dependent oxidoreductase